MLEKKSTLLISGKMLVAYESTIDSSLSIDANKVYSAVHFRNYSTEYDKLKSIPHLQRLWVNKLLFWTYTASTASSHDLKVFLQLFTAFTDEDVHR